MAKNAPKPRMPAEDKRRLVRFYLIAFGWTWALWIPALIWSSSTGVSLPTMEAGFGAWRELSGVALALAVGFQLAVYGPLVAAVAVLLRLRSSDGGSGLRAWVESVTRLQVSIGWWAFVVAAPVVLAALVVAAGALAGGGMPRWAALPSALGLLGLLGIQLVTSGMEEPGWRGFALPLLQRTHDAENASWYLGLMWAAWHLPYVIYLNREAPVWSVPLTVAGFGMSIIAMGYVHAWVFNSTGSLPLNIGLHAWANVTNTLAAALMPNPIVPLVTAGITWAFVAWLLRRYGKETLAAEG